MTEEKTYKIAIGSKDYKNWFNKEITWDDFCNMLNETKRTKETVKEYFEMTTEQRGKIKNVGGFVCGYCKDGKRNKNSVSSRSMVCLDLDNKPGTDGIKHKLDIEEVWNKAKVFKSCMYTTHSHTPEEPRLRIIVALDREVTPEEYEKVSKSLAHYISNGNMSIFDNTTYQYERLMYLPSTCKDGEFIFRNSNDNRVLKKWEAKVEVLLRKYDNDIKPLHKAENRRGNTIQDPTTKNSYIGAFCKAYDIHDAISTYLFNEYVPGSKENRYTYTNGHSGDGLQVFDDGLFAFSYQDTDPIRDKGNCNSFDLVRIHLFGDLDSEEDINNLPPNKLPSFKKMCELVINDVKAKKYLNEEDFEKIEDQEKSKQKRDIKFFDFAKSLNSSPIQEPEFLIRRLIYDKSINLIVGDPKTFKTYIALDIALGVIMGSETLGHNVLKKGKVLLISTELDVRSRLLTLLNGRGLKLSDVENKLYMFSYNDSLDTFEWNKDKKILENYIKDLKPDLVILDPISYIFDGEITDNDEVKQFFRELKELIIKYNFSVILTHHNNRMKNTNRNGKISGAAAFSRHSDSVIHLEKFSDDEKQDINKTDEELDQEVKPIKLIKGDYRYGGTGYRYYTINFKFEKGSTKIVTNRLELDDIVVNNKKTLQKENKRSREEDILKRLVYSIKEGKFNKEGIKKADIMIIINNNYGVSDNTFNEDIKKALGILINDGYIERNGYYYKVINDNIDYPFL